MHKIAWVGDQIVSVDGHDVTGDDASHYRALARVPAGQSVVLGLEGGDGVTITATKKP